MLRKWSKFLITTFPNWVCLCKSLSRVDKIDATFYDEITCHVPVFWECCTSTDKLRVEPEAPLLCYRHCSAPLLTGLKTNGFRLDTVGCHFGDFTFALLKFNSFEITLFICYNKV